MPVGRETMRGTLGSWSSSRRASIRRALGALEIHANLGLWCPLGSALTRPAAALLEASPEDHRDHHRSGYTDIYIYSVRFESRAATSTSLFARTDCARCFSRRPFSFIFRLLFFLQVRYDDDDVEELELATERALSGVQRIDVEFP